MGGTRRPGPGSTRFGSRGPLKILRPPFGAKRRTHPPTLHKAFPVRLPRAVGEPRDRGLRGTEVRAEPSRASHPPTLHGGPRSRSRKFSAIQDNQERFLMLSPSSPRTRPPCARPGAPRGAGTRGTRRGLGRGISRGGAFLRPRMRAGPAGACRTLGGAARAEQPPRGQTRAEDRRGAHGPGSGSRRQRRRLPRRSCKLSKQWARVCACARVPEFHFVTFK